MPRPVVARAIEDLRWIVTMMRGVFSSAIISFGSQYNASQMPPRGRIRRTIDEVLYHRCSCAGMRTRRALSAGVGRRCHIELEVLLQRPITGTDRQHGLSDVIGS